jgi:transcriptional regulator with XRE-family HTH domain
MADSAVILALPSVDPDQVEIGRRLRRLREGRGLQVADLARAMRIDASVLRLAEQGRARLTSGQLYAATLMLRIPMRLLFEGEIEAAAIRPISL